MCGRLWGDDLTTNYTDEPISSYIEIVLLYSKVLYANLLHLLIIMIIITVESTPTYDINTNCFFTILVVILKHAKELLNGLQVGIDDVTPIVWASILYDLGRLGILFAFA